MNELSRIDRAAAGSSSAPPASLWAATAPPGPALERLTGRRTAEVAVIGAGYTGLSTALHLAEAGVEAVVIDTHEPGWGASGRNGGQVLPGLRHSRDVLQQRFGAEVGGRLFDLCETAPDCVSEIVARHGIACDLLRTGHYRLAHSAHALAMIRDGAAVQRAQGVAVRVLDAGEVARETGAAGYLGGRYDPRSGTLHPLKYARGLAAAALGKGAAIYGQSPATALRREGERWVVATPEGEISAPRVVIATNGYTGGLWPRLAETVLPVHSFQVATAPLDQAALASVLPGRQCFSDTRRLILYAQRSADNRLVLGGRASFTVIDRPEDYDVLRGVLDRLFPQIAGVPIDYRWAGRVGLTRDFTPHLHEPEPGLLIALGFNGKGVAMTSLMGKLLARRIVAPAEAIDYPVTKIMPIPFHRFRQPALDLAMRYHTVMDRLGR